jgi:hypothetical protein
MRHPATTRQKLKDVVPEPQQEQGRSMSTTSESSQSVQPQRVGTISDVIHWQKVVGNQAIQRLLQRQTHIQRGGFNQSDTVQAIDDLLEFKEQQEQIQKLSEGLESVAEQISAIGNSEDLRAASSNLLGAAESIADSTAAFSKLTGYLKGIPAEEAGTYVGKVKASFDFITAITNRTAYTNFRTKPTRETTKMLVADIDNAFKSASKLLPQIPLVTGVIEKYLKAPGVYLHAVTAMLNSHLDRIDKNADISDDAISSRAGFPQWKGPLYKFVGFISSGGGLYQFMYKHPELQHIDDLKIARSYLYHLIRTAKPEELGDDPKQTRKLWIGLMNIFFQDYP